MTIGLDIDDTITNSSDLIFTFVKKYFNTDDVNIVREIIGGEIEGELLKFYDAHLGEMVANYTLKDNVKEVIERLRKKGHRVVIITARGYTKTKDSIIKITKKYLQKHNIKVDKIVFNKLDKDIACVKNNIDIMIDDSVSTLEKIRAKNIKVLLYTSIGNKEVTTNIDRVNNWLELEDYIDELNRKEEVVK